jgi:Protein of unknown function (DUF2695)
MSSKEEKARRKTLVRALQEKEAANAEAQMPLSKSDLADLFDWVDEKLADGCDRTLKHTLEFIRTKRLAEQAIVPWLAQYGGHCDCEVIANVEDSWRKNDGSIGYNRL